MRYRILGETVPVVEMLLDRGESVYTQAGGMTWMSDGIDMQTNTKGGLMKGLGRMLGGESLFMATYTARADQVLIGFAATVPGSVYPVDLSEMQGLICQKGAFLCAQSSVDVRAIFNKKLGAGLFGGEGFILQQLSGQGMAFLEIDGDKIVKELAPGERIKVDTGNVVAFEPSVSYDIEMIRGGMNIFLGGEGLFMTTLTGPGKVILQTQNFMEFIGRVRRYIPTQSS